MKGFLTLLLLFWACLAGATLTATGAAPSLTPTAFNKNLILGVDKSTPWAANRLSTIVIDAGHGGHDSGCDHAPEMEKTVNLSVARMLAAAITANYPDIEVILTRDDDKFIELEDRAALANNSDADLFISLHANYAENKEAFGTETWIYDRARGQRDRQSKLFAKFVEQFFELSGRKSRGIHKKSFSVLANTRMPAVLVELGFLSNSQEQNYLLSPEGQLDLTNSLFEAFGSYYKMVTGREPAEAIVSVRPAPVPAPKSSPKPAPKAELTFLELPAPPEAWVGKEITPGLEEPLASTAANETSVTSSTTPTAKAPPISDRVKKPLIKLPPPITGDDAPPIIIAVQVAALSKPWASVPDALSSLAQRITQVRDENLYRYQICHLATEAEARELISLLKAKGQDGMLVVYRGQQRLTGSAMSIALNSLAASAEQRMAK